MKKLNCICVLVLAVLMLGACSSKKRCKGGGWYGNRNLTMEDKQKAKTPAPVAQLPDAEEDCAP
ncbi:MAG: hypothetical protein AAGG75_22280 [Bacteroidota bacterium]